MLCEMLPAISLAHRAAQEHYGQAEKDSVQRVKTVYNNLGLEQRFFDYEQVGFLPLHCLAPKCFTDPYL